MTQGFGSLVPVSSWLNVSVKGPNSVKLNTACSSLKVDFSRDNRLAKAALGGAICAKTIFDLVENECGFILKLEAVGSVSWGRSSFLSQL